MYPTDLFRLYFQQLPKVSRERPVGALVVCLSICLCLVPLPSHAAAIHDAAKKGAIAALSAALEAGANINQSDGTATPLYHAVNGAHLGAAKLLIERGADPNAQSVLGITPLGIAIGKRNIELMKLLLDHGAHPNSAVGRQTVLHLAAAKGCLDCVKALVEAGADVNAPTSDYEYRTPLHLAKRGNFPEVADYLMTHGVIIPKPAPISAKLAAADTQKGQTVFEANCGACHAAMPEGHKVAASMWDVVGRDKAALAGIGYSDTLKSWGGVWTYEDLNTYLYGPTLTTPGVLMEIRGVPDEIERVNLIAYLRTLSDKPLPLP
jgi:cytochrome c